MVNPPLTIFNIPYLWPITMARSFEYIYSKNVFFLNLYLLKPISFFPGNLNFYSSKLRTNAWGRVWISRMGAQGWLDIDYVHTYVYTCVYCAHVYEDQGSIERSNSCYIQTSHDCVHDYPGTTSSRSLTTVRRSIFTNNNYFC